MNQASSELNKRVELVYAIEKKITECEKQVINLSLIVTTYQVRH